MPSTRNTRSTGTFASVLAFVRTRLFEIYVVLMSCMVGLAIIVYYQWTKKPAQVRKLLRFWSSCFIYGARFILGVRFVIEGRENIPSEPVIFMGNHQTYWESVAMTVFFPDINVVTKRSAMLIPVFGWGLKHAPMIPVDRSMPGQNIRRFLKDGKASIRAGRNILIFPEGSRVPVGENRPYARGFEMLYKVCKAKVVPFATDAGLVWPSGFKTKHPGTITMRFLPSIDSGKDTDEFASELEATIRQEAAALAAQEPR